MCPLFSIGRSRSFKTPALSFERGKNNSQSRGPLSEGALARLFGGDIAQGHIMIFPVMAATGLCMLQKDLADKSNGISEDCFSNMLKAGTGFIMLLAYAKLAGIKLDDNYDVLGELKQPRKAVRDLSCIQPLRLKTGLNT